MFEEDAINNNNKANDDDNSISYINVIDDSPEPKKTRTCMKLDSSSDSEDDPDFSLEEEKPDAFTPLIKHVSRCLDCKRSVTQGSVSSVCKKKQCPTLSKDDFELAIVEIFGNRTFRPLQHQACEASAAKQDCFVLMPTGGAKSLCDQLPATLKPGVIVVISPLLSLIQDQITTLDLKFGIPATDLNSQQTAAQAAARCPPRAKDKPSSKLLYATPERIAGNPAFLGPKLRPRKIEGH